MAKFMVCNKWTLGIDDKYLDVANTAGAFKPYFHAAVTRKLDVAREAWCYNALLDRIDATIATSVFEYFGGMGMTATIIQHKLDPAYHGINDLDVGSVQHLRSLSLQFDTVYQMDTLELALLDTDDLAVDLVCLDFHSYTIHQWATKPDVRQAIDAVMARQPEYVIITDSAVSRLHLHKQMYGDEYNNGVPLVTPTDYVMCADNHYCAAYGYVVHTAAHHNRACYMLLVADDNIVTQVLQTPPEADTYFRQL